MLMKVLLYRGNFLVHSWLNLQMCTSLLNSLLSQNLSLAWKNLNVSNIKNQINGWKIEHRKQHGIQVAPPPNFETFILKSWALSHDNVPKFSRGCLCPHPLTNALSINVEQQKYTATLYCRKTTFWCQKLLWSIDCGTFLGVVLRFKFSCRQQPRLY